MIFTTEEIQRLFNIIDYRLARIVGDVLGKGYLSPADKIILDSFGFKWEERLKIISPYHQAFLFGRLSGVLNPTQLRALNYSDIEIYTKTPQFNKLTNREKSEFNASAVRTYTYIKGLGEKIKETLSTSISQEELQIAVEERKQIELRTIKEEISRGVLERKSVQRIVSAIGNRLNDWNRDWGRIVETEFQGVYLLGVAQQIMDEHGSDALVYKQPLPGACKYCLKFYTTAGAGSKPRIFKISSLIANGTNIGRKQRDWQPVLESTHPFCRCPLRHIPKGYVWDEELKTFVPPKNYERKVERKSKVTITIGSKKFEV